MKYRTSLLDQIGYYGSVLLTFGMTWVMKTIIVKAIVDAQNSAYSDEIKK